MTDAAPAADAPPPSKRRPNWTRRLLVAAGLLLVVLIGFAAVVRYGAVTPVGRSLAEQLLDGLEVGGYGKLHVEGLDGDIFQDFAVRRLTIDDGKGPWLDAKSVRLRWNWLDIFARRIDIDELDAAKLTLAHQPVVKQTGAGSREAPVSVHIGKLALQLELLPGFSTRYGLYDVTGSFDTRREGGMAGRFAAASRTHAGDHLDADFDLGRDKTIRLTLQAQEAGGGALAGALGLAADQPFFVTANATGTVSQGQFQVRSRSGQLVPITGQGAWTPQGGQATGQITLAATRYLSGFQRMLGPQAQFQIAGARAPDGLYALTFSANSENVDISGHGEADIGRAVTGPAGVAVDIATRDAKRIVGWPQMGAGHMNGVLTLDASGWSLAGPAVVEAPAALGYRLAEARGPLEVSGRNGEIDVKTTIDGSGGAGSNLIAAFLGARPHASVELALLSGGHVLIRQLQVLGPGLKIDATGDRSMFGGLQFKGQGTLTNFTFAAPNAHGAVTATWTAGQSGAEPWKVSFDGTGKGLVTGWPELDRLLGPAPNLTGAGAIDGKGFEISQANLTGAAGALNGTGLIAGDGGLDLKLGWKAKGPFEIGPLEIAGAADGSGALGGTIGDPRADFAANFASIDLPELRLTDAHATISFLKGPADTNGAFSLVASSPYGPAKAQTGFRFVAGGLDLTGLDVTAGGAHALGSVALRDGAPSSADLTLEIGPGAFLTRGEAQGHLAIVDAPGGARADLKLAATGAVTKMSDFIIQKGSLTASGPLSALPYQLQASGFTPHGSWNAAGSGTFNDTGGDYGVTFAGQGRLRNADFKTIQPLTVRFGHGQAALNLLANVGGGQAQVQATQSADAVQAKATLSNVSLGLLDQDFVGRFDADISLAGQGSNLNGSLDAKLSGAGERGAGAGLSTLNGEVKGTLSGSVATLDANLGNGQGLSSQAHLVMPAVASASPFHIEIVRNAPMHGEFSADGEVRPLWDLIMGGERSLAGQVHAHATLTGTLDDPQAAGEASIANGQFSDAASGLKLTGVTMAAQLQHNAIDVSQFTGQDGAGGSVTGSGLLSLERAGASSFKLDFQHFRLLDNDLATATATGQATLSRSADGSVKLAGALTIDRGDVAANPPVPTGVTQMDVTEINREPGVGGHLQSVASNAPAVALDVTLKSTRGVFIKGRGLNVEMALDAHVTGTTAAPQLTGVATVVRGDYDFAGKRFEFDNRSNVRLAADLQHIRLDLTATREDPTLTAVIHIEGTADKPKVTLSSTPVLPNDEVLSQVLFGSSAAQLSPFDAAELASAMTSLSGGSGFDLLGNLRSFAHLDRLALGGGPGVAVSGGKYITDKIYLEVGGGAAGPVAGVEWRIRKDLSLVSKVAGAGGDSQIEVRWRKDY